MARFHRAPLLVLMLVLSLHCLAGGNEAGLEAGFHDKPDWFKHSFLDLGEDVAEAADSGKRIMLYFHQDGCPYCAKLLNENFTLKTLVDKTREHFEIIAINIWGDREVTGLQGESTTEKAFAASQKVMYTPTLVFLDEQGRKVLRLNGYYPPHKFGVALDYVSGRLEQQLSYRDYLAKVQPAAASGKLHQEDRFLPRPLDLRPTSREGEKHLLVLMEQKQCPACDELHVDILARPELRQTLAAFDVALVDVWSAELLTTPSGAQLKSIDWAAERGIHYAPSLLFFDREGREVFRSDAYLKAFHIQAAMEYVSSGAYRGQANFQRFVQARADELRAQGIEPELMK